MSNQQNNPSLKDQVENLNSHLVMIKSLKDSEAEVEYCNLLEKAKSILGQISPFMARFYFEYGSFMLNKVQSSVDLFNPEAVPQAQADDGIASYDSAYEQQDESEEDGANQEKVQKTQNNLGNVQEKDEKKQQKDLQVVYQDDNVQITESLNDKNKQRIGEEQGFKEQQQDDMTDIECAYENLEVALNIYQKEREKLQNGEQSVLQKQDIFNYILCIHIRLGELYMFDQKFEDAIGEFNTVIKMARGHEKPEMKRRASQSHYNIGNCLLHLNKQNCQIEAIKEYIASHNELLKFIQEKQNYEISQIQVPTISKFNVNRFGYLYKPLDSDLVRDIKDVMGLLLDKIEDTALQIQIRPKFEKQKQKMNLIRQQTGFKQVSKDVKVTNLGTFGNRKKTQPPSTNFINQQIQLQNKQKVETSNNLIEKQKDIQGENKEDQNPKKDVEI